MSDDEYELPDLGSNPPKKPRGYHLNRSGRPKGSKNKPKTRVIPPPPPSGTPSRNEWRDVTRIIFNGLVEQLQHRDEETGRLTASSALYRAASDLVKESETLYEEDQKEKDEQSQLEQQLKEKRSTRKLLIKDNDVHINPMPSMAKKLAEDKLAEKTQTILTLSTMTKDD